jgi:hypothetical protein
MEAEGLMGRPRIYKTNAERQAAYRARKAKAERGDVSVPNQSIVRRVMAAEGRKA